MKKAVLCAMVCAAAVTTGPAVVATSADAAPARVSAVRLLSKLPVRAETHTSSYARAEFGRQVDANHDGEDTRTEVLRAESKSHVTISGAGAVRSGRWVSLYDGRTVRAGSKLVVDQLVPLAEAWSSGAWRWSS